MDQKVLSGLLNPVRMRIFQYVLSKQEATTSEIRQQVPHVPQASLYRLIGKMQKDGILYVCGENKIRGVYEKIYGIKGNPLEALTRQVDLKDKKQLYETFYAFAMSLLMDFGGYLEDDTIDLKEDRVGFRSFPTYMSDEECDAFMADLNQVMKKHTCHDYKVGRRMRKFSYVMVPVDEREKDA